MKKLNIIFMGTPAFALPALQMLHESSHSVVAVYTQPPRPAGRGQKDTRSPVHEYAAAHGLPVFTPASLKDTSVQAEFAAHNADVAVVAAYGLLLPQAVLQGPGFGCINIHPSLLPRWRGAAPIQRTLMAGDRETAVCIMQMNAGLDTGPVLARQHYPVPANMNAGALHDALSALGARLTLQVLEKLPDITPQPQPAEGITYADKITKQDCRISWQKSAQEICNQIRALSPEPGAWFEFGDELIKVFAAEVHSVGAITPGTVLNDKLAIACGEGTLTPLLVQRPGKRRMPAAEMLKGLSVPAGSVVS